MLQGKQTDRLVSKVSRLCEVYFPFVFTRLPQRVFFEQKGNVREVRKGFRWGKDFATGNFLFTVSGVEQGKKYCIYADTGATEHLVCVNGEKAGMLDFVAHAADAPSRIHRYFLPSTLNNGDRVTLEAYYSHPIPGTMPYDGTSTFSLDGLYPDRPFEEAGIAEMYLPLYDFCQKLALFNSRYQSEKDGFRIAEMQKVYLRLFEVLSMKQQRPNETDIQKATEILDDYFGEADKLPFVGIIGHSHLDTAWLWPVEETRRKLMRTLSNAVTLLERHPDYKFFLSTVLYLKWVEEDDPVLFEKVKKFVAEGRLETNGSTWVECDGNLTGAEAFCRQFLRGKLYLREKFHYQSDTFWLPDTFGYSAALPQIMKLADVSYFLTTKLSWNDTNRFPYESFLWKGIDGSTVTVHFNTIHTWVDDKAVQKRLDDVADKSESRCLFMAYGFGDGGGGPSEEMVKRAIHTQYNCKKAEVRHTTVSDFMKKLSEQQLPTYFGELYLELHRGTYTTNHSLKQCNRRLEEALHDAEAVSVFADDKQAKNLTDGWYDVLMLNQFHDILPGTAIAQASDVALAQLKKALKEAKEYMSGKGAKRYFNTLPFKRREVLPSATGQSYIDLFGKKRTVASYQFAPYGYGKKVADKGGFCFDGENVTTPQLTAKLKNGVLVSLVYKDREYVKKGFNVVRCAEDVPYIYDNWDIDADYVLKEKDAQFLRQDVVSVGATLLVVRAVYRLTEKSLLYTDIKFRADTPLVEFENRLCFYDTHTVVRTYFDTTLFAQRYRCETQFGFVERNCFPQDKSDIAKFEVCSHKWTDLSEKNCGLSLLSDSKYGVSCNGGKMGLTLHKSGTHPDSRGDVGESTFRYALLPHTGDLTMETVCHAYCFSHLPISTARQNLHPPFEVVSDGSVVTETIKFGEKQGIVLRLYECLGGSASATVRAAGKQIVSCNIMEDTLAVLGEDCAQLQFSPFEIKTVILK